MTRYTNFLKATALTPLTAETLYEIINNTPELARLTGVQCAAVAALMYQQKEYGYNECLKENSLL
jgi:hypothetical protein